MENVNRNWNAANVSETFDGEVAAMVQGGLNLVAAGTLYAIDAVYWSKSAKADEVFAAIEDKLTVLAYKKSRKADYVKAIRQLAGNFVKKYGAPHAVAAKRNAFYTSLLEAEKVSDAVALIVAAIKTDYNSA